eukprot:GILK01005255.1.p1 GENE.GILK01005255.1~~GILK01005255.1.p1  ORF type:complete len:741 (-),score=130.71 GILK01005255.1:180-2360(-)
MAVWINMRLCVCVLVVLGALSASADADAETFLSRSRHQLLTRGSVAVGSLHVSIEVPNNRIEPRLMTVVKKDDDKITVEFRRTTKWKGNAKKSDSVTFEIPEDPIAASCDAWHQQTIRVNLLEEFGGPVIRFSSLISCELFNKLIELAAAEALPLARSLDVLAREIVSDDDCKLCKKVNEYYGNSAHATAALIAPNEENKLCEDQKESAAQNGGVGAAAEKGKKDLKTCLWFVAAHKGALMGKFIDRRQCPNVINNNLDAEARSEVVDNFCYQELQVCTTPLPSIRANRGFEVYDLDLLFQLRDRAEQNMKMTVLSVLYNNEVGTGSGLTHEFLHRATTLFLEMLQDADAINVFPNVVTSRDLMTIPPLQTMFMFGSREADKKQEVTAWIDQNAELLRMFGRTLALTLNLQCASVKGVQGDIIIPFNLPAMLLQKLLTPSKKATYDWTKCPKNDLLCHHIHNLCGESAFADCYGDHIKKFTLFDGTMPCFAPEKDVPVKEKKFPQELHLLVPTAAEPTTYAEYAGMWADHLYSLKNPAFRVLFEGFWEVFADKNGKVKVALSTEREGMGSTFLKDGVVDQDKLDAFELQDVQDDQPNLHDIAKGLYGVAVTTKHLLEHMKYTNKVPQEWKTALDNILTAFDRHQKEKFVRVVTGRTTLLKEGSIAIDYTEDEVKGYDLPPWPKASTCASSLTFFGPVQNLQHLQENMKLSLEQYMDAALAQGFNEI